MELYKLEAYSRLSLEIEFKTYSNDGILLYNGQTSSKSGDFVSLTVKDGLLNSDIIWGAKSRNSQLLDLVDNLFVGFVPGFSKVISLTTGVEHGLNGCIRHLKIERREVNLKYPSSKEILRSYGIGECGGNACSAIPCKNGGTCVSSEHKNFQCQCVEGFSGEKCEIKIDPCSSNPCGEAATCVAVSQGEFTCKCGPQRTGKFCDKPRKDLGDVSIPDFSNSSYLEFPPLQNIKHAFSMEIWFLARSPDGVLIYDGQKLNKKGDFIAVNLANGYVSFVYNLGSGSANITSRHPVSLNEWHSLKISRLRRQGTLKVDNETTIVGKSKPPLTELNLALPFYIGGVPNTRHVHQDSGVIKV
ncbi:hypothetical protein CEXT_695371 [Caerostris extrusa]|uniref:Agrin n=1 Tax=Caerostris extrusa TaxID=172846 RepID=A0AAV4MCI6_CAEEX|nr:hypothetical protein CEXT_695371 [Caerostris extrusa]